MAIRRFRARATPLRTARHAVLIGSFLASCAPSDPGLRVWKRKCAGCHGADGRASAAYRALHPFADLRDGRWRHGADLASISRVVATGDPRSPMPAFEGRLSPEEIAAVSRRVVAFASSHESPGDAP